MIGSAVECEDVGGKLRWACGGVKEELEVWSREWDGDYDLHD